MPLTETSSVDDLRAQLAPFEEAAFTTIDPHDAEFSFEDNIVRFRAVGADWGISSLGYLAACQMYGIPRAYALKCPPELLVPHLNYFIRESPLTAATFTSSPASGIVDGFVPGEIEPVRFTTALDSVARRFGGDLIVHHSHVSREWVQFGVVTPDEVAVSVGDPIRSGVMISGSFDFSRDIEVSAYTNRLVCTNGAVSTDYIFRQKRSEGQAGLNSEWLEDALTAAFEARDNVIHRLATLQSRQLSGEGTSDYLNSVFEEFGVPAAVRPRVLGRIIDQGGIENGYDLWNAVTWVASHDPDLAQRPRQSLRLMGVAGEIERHPAMCDACHRVL